MATYLNQDYFAKMQQVADELDEMARITSGFEKIINDEDTDKLEVALQLRQRNLNNISKLQKEMKEIQSQLGASLEQDGTYQKLLLAMNEKRDQVYRLDEKMRELGTMKMDEYRAGMRKNNENRKGVDAYLGTVAQSNMFDKKS